MFFYAIVVFDLIREFVPKIYYSISKKKKKTKKKKKKRTKPQK